jgi:sec-independent protein translocase protein TatB
MFDFSLDKVVVILLVVVLLVGPKRLPEYAARLAQIVKRLRVMADGAQARVRDELGPDFEDLDWKKLDPRQYDPRQIIRDSLLGEVSSPATVGTRLPNPFDEVEPAPGPAVESSDSPPINDPVPGG